MITVECPVCGEETVEFKWERDSQGEGPWAMSFDYLEFHGQECKCTLPEGWIDAKERELHNDGPPEFEGDYY